MRVHHIAVRRTAPVQIPAALLAQLPRKIALCTTSQFLGQLATMQEQLSEAGKESHLYNHRHTATPGQVLGCSTESVDADAVLFVGEGQFHPQALAYANECTVYCYDPVSHWHGTVDKALIDRRKKKREAGIKTFHHANKVGVLVSTKSGQKDVLALQRLKTQYPNKQFYAFLGNTMPLEALEDFPFVEVWLNTACPRIGYDDIDKTSRPLINAEDVLSEHRF